MEINILLRVTLSWDPRQPKVLAANEKTSLRKMPEYTDIPLTISIKKRSKILFFDGIVSDSQQILLLKMRTPPKYGDSIRISAIKTEEIILKLYDYLEVIGTGDGVANFISDYNIACRMEYVGKQLDCLRSDYLLAEKTCTE